MMEYFNKEELLQILVDKPSKIKYASEILRNDYDVAICLVKTNSFKYYQFLGDEILNNVKFLVEAINPIDWKNYQNDKEYILKIAKCNLKLLELTNDKIKDNEEIMYEILKKDKLLDCLLSDRLKKDRKFQNLINEIYKEDYRGNKLKEILAQNQKNIEKELNINNQIKEILKSGDFNEVLDLISFNGYLLFYVSNELKDNEDIVLSAIKNHGSAFQFASQRLKDDRDFVLKVVSLKGYALCFASEKLREDETIVVTAMNNHPNALLSVDEKFLSNEKFARLAAKKSKYALQYLDTKINNYVDIVIIAIDSFGFEIFKYCSIKSIKDRISIIKLINLFGYKIINYLDKYVLLNLEDETITNLLREEFYQPVKKEIFTLKGLDKNIYNDNASQMLHIVKYKPEEIRFISNRLKNDYYFLLKAIIINGMCLQYLDKKLCDNEEIVFEAVRSNRLAFEYASERLRNNKELALIAVKKDGQLLPYIGKDLISDKDVIFTAIKNKNASIKNIDLNLRNNKDFMLKVLENNGLNLEYASEKLKDDEDIVKLAVKNNYESLMYASERLRNDKDMIFYILDNHKPNEYYFIGAEISCNKNFIRELKVRLGNKFEEFLPAMGPVEDKDFSLELVKENGSWLQYIHDSTSEDKDIVLEAIRDNKENIIHAGIDILKDNEFISKYIQDENLLNKINEIIYSHENYL